MIRAVLVGVVMTQRVGTWFKNDRHALQKRPVSLASTSPITLRSAILKECEKFLSLHPVDRAVKNIQDKVMNFVEVVK